MPEKNMFFKSWVGKMSFLFVAAAVTGPAAQAASCQIYLYSCPNQDMPLYTWFQDGDSVANAHQERCQQRASEYHDWCGATKVHAIFYDDAGQAAQYPYRTQCNVYNPNRGWEIHPGVTQGDCGAQAQSFADSSGMISTGIFQIIDDLSWQWKPVWGAYAYPNYGARSPYIPAGFSQVFGDEFNENQLDTSKWFTRYIYGGPEGGVMDGTNNFQNGGPERYGESFNHVMTGTSIKLTAYGAGWEHPSGMLRSKKTFKYGYFETRMKLPKGHGTFPAVWMVPDSLADGRNGGYPPEIDFFEYVNQYWNPEAPFTIYTGFRSNYNAGSQYIYAASGFKAQPYGGDEPSYVAGFRFDDDFHIYGALWNVDDTISIYIDGNPIAARTFQYKKEDGSDPALAHLLINLAAGASDQWASIVDENWDLDPRALEIDYVRVYQSPGMQLGTAFIGQPFCDWTGQCGGSPLTRPGLAFGGMYGYGYDPSSGQITQNVNILTGGMSCPANYTSQQILGTNGVDFPLFACYRNLANGEAPEYDFGGMFGVGSGGAYKNPLTNSASCSPGFATSLVLNAPATDYPLYYCVRSHTDDYSSSMNFYGAMGYVNGQMQNNAMAGAGHCPYGLKAIQTFGTAGLDYPVYYCATNQ